MQQLAQSECANFFPAQSSDISIKVAERSRTIPRRLGMIMQVTPPDEHGYVNLGLDNFYTSTVMEQCDFIIAEVNQLPRSFGEMNFHVSNLAPLLRIPIRFRLCRPHPYPM